MAKVDYNPKPIDEEFFNNPKYPVTGNHQGHEVRAEGIQRFDADNKPYPTKLGIHGTNVAVDLDACVGDGICMDVCPVDVFEWFLNPGKKGSENETKIEIGSDLWNKYRTDKTDMVREKDCILCGLCVTSCPSLAISVAQRK